MGLIDSILNYFKSKPIQEVYCQSCGKNLTSEGGDVSNSGGVYCHNYNGTPQCLMLAVFKSNEKVSISNFYNSREIQKLIRKSELTKFGSLERKLI